ncbi:MAG: 3-isopropylmalate dehydratase small subunit [Nitrososphaerota archaeon]|jgi:3-isopropylmalate dehydratase small subunit|nr:3-isopropylmalate dehydratase small subunit [Nitrososphaerota archaeon]MDG7042714.1 3-isopropylmalate dehydratase small subunit [Nitrososphaerota archaeon]MDG7045624.1 3-isopropylmalate dehydratase small subunit [Nitrososphaerota archaeon]MDG7046113.1 3-isopropylmalate dehydratase small subunit [Nitrososphaerota archaeon]MDG7047376.1 3-isopropylmalate dehydratase small subunit [Nitrososphaerota archaeon]
MDVVAGLAVPLLRENVDTDQIIPAQFLRILTKNGLGRYLFYRWRYDQDGKPTPGFVLNDERFRKATVLLALKNFGIGSSRENAVWALTDYGIKAVIAPSFGDIFYENAVKNGLVCIRIDEKLIQQIGKEAEAGGLTVRINIKEQSLSYGSQSIHYTMEPSVRRRLMSGEDEIENTIKYENKIMAYEQRMKKFYQIDRKRLLYE